MGREPNGRSHSGYLDQLAWMICWKLLDHRLLLAEAPKSGKDAKLGAKLRSAVGGAVGPHPEKAILDQLKDDLLSIGYKKAAKLVEDGEALKDKDLDNSNDFFPLGKTNFVPPRPKITVPGILTVNVGNMMVSLLESCLSGCVSFQMMKLSGKNSSASYPKITIKQRMVASILSKSRHASRA